ncbi:hypothetical protein ULMS_20210 [Patiriisocius marinistellae]|uniref:Uncharacterized protein n=1 Tax=Patiriisocius marinistellae TaxID=2494560 RepID=A0A5J4FWV9_9FLAO|nr:YihY/virulence factor BrkB family protein [Patiriisocius marinistellae]GEQ86513.1 hypothetical protein ULMS_20210 [Patiriisocius marinistellae]
MKKIFKLLKDTYSHWDSIDPWATSAIIAYYALFSLPSVLMISVSVAGIFFGTEAVTGSLTKELSVLMGEGSAEAIEGMIKNAMLEDSGAITYIIGIGMLIFGATAVFFQLQKALNSIWGVRAKTESIINTMKRRVTAFGLVAAIAFLLLISLGASAVIDVFSNYLSTYYSKTSAIVVEVFNIILSQIFITALFASIFSILPDVKLKWKYTILGASVTSLMFLLGKYGIGYYFANSNPASVFGAASGVVLVLLWVYYSCLILFFGASFTVVWTNHRNIIVEPTNDATISYARELSDLKSYKAAAEMQHNQEKDKTSL